MRKFLPYLLSVLLLSLSLAAFTACGGGHKPSEPDTITVTYYEQLNSAPQTKKVEKDALNGYISLTRAGYEYLGLFDAAEGGMQVFDATGAQLYALSSDVTLYARWSRVTYTKPLTVPENGTLSQTSVKVKDGDTVAELPLPEVTYGYQFVGWMIGDVMISEGVIVYDDYMSVSAETATLWFNEEPLVAVIRQAEYKVTFFSNDGTGKSETVIKKHGESIDSYPALPDNEAGKMDFGGWSMSMTEYVPFETSPDCAFITRDISIYGFWKRWRTVTFVVKEGEEHDERVYENQPFTIPEYENPGYTLDGWFRSQKFDTVPETTIRYESAYPKYYASWSLATYTLKFVTGTSEIVPDKTYQFTDNFDLPSLEMPGYVFRGWCESETFTDSPVAEIKTGSYGDKTLYAKFTSSISLNLNGGTARSETADVIYNCATTIEVPRLTGYAFNGWFDAEDNRVTDNEGKMVNPWRYADLSSPLIAKYSEKLYITVTYEYKNSGMVSLDEYYVEGQTVTLSAVPASGYSFAGFFNEDGEIVCGTSKYTFTMGASDLALMVSFRPAEYELSLNADGGYCRQTTATVKYHETFTLPIAYKDGMIFDGWMFEGIAITDKDGNSLDVWDITYGGMIKASYAEDTVGLVTIKTADDFMKIKDNPAGYYCVLEDIDLFGYQWTPCDFTGTLVGDNVTISNLMIEAESGNAGLFLNMKGAIRNLKFENLRVTSTAYDSVNVGGICAVLSGKIENVEIVSGRITANNSSAGAFAGYMESGTIKNCVNSAEVHGTANDDGRGTGGFAGVVKSGELTALTNYGTVSGGKYVGGLAGRTTGDGVVLGSNLENMAAVEGTGNYVGGLLGYYSRTSAYNIFDFANRGNITGAGCVGGIFGAFYNKTNYRDNNTHFVNITGITNTGAITASGNYAGGLFGYLEFEGVANGSYDNYRNGAQGANVKNAKNTGNVSGANYVGGLAGYFSTDTGDSVIEKGKSSAIITSTEGYIGGLIGRANNVDLTSPDNTGSSVSSSGAYIDGSSYYAYLGGYVGCGEGVDVSGAHNAVEINYSASADKGSYVGGLFGYITGILTDCENVANVYAPSSSCVGGVAGKQNRTNDYNMKNLKNSGNVTGAGSVGGVFGQLVDKTNYRDNNRHYTNIDGIVNSGEIVSSGDNVGGLIGYLEFEGVPNGSYDNARNGSHALNIQNAENTGNVTGNYFVGGLLGKSLTDDGASVIERGKSFATVTGTAYVGGLLGKVNNIDLTAPSNAGSRIVAAGAYIDGSSYYAYVGGYVGCGEGVDVSDAHNAVEINYSASADKGAYVGGLFGYITGILTDCENVANVYAPNSSCVGGIAGKQNRTDDYTMKSLKNSGNVTGAGSVGGIFGQLVDRTNYRDNNRHYTNIDGIVNSGEIVSSGDDAGGLIGYLEFEGVANGSYDNYRNGSHALNMQNAENTGNVTGNCNVGGWIGRGLTDDGASVIERGKSSATVTGTAYVGGVAGRIQNIDLISPSNEGSSVIATGAYVDSSVNYAYVGGYVGHASGVDVSDAYNAVEIDYSATANKGDYVGGLFGYITGVLTNCENTANVYAPNSSRVGGIAGSQNRTEAYTMTSLKNSGAVSGINYVGGIFGIFYNKTNYRDNDTHYTKMIDIANSGEITATGNYAGGLIGYMDFEGLANGSYDNYRNAAQALTMQSAVNTGNVTGIYRVGGLIGYGTTDSGNSLITEGKSSAVIIGTAYIGGLLGEVNNIDLASPDNAGSTVSAIGAFIDGTEKYAFFGGYVGRGTGVDVSDAHNAVTIDYSATQNKGIYVGGLFGYITGILTNCENTANVYAPGASRVGGIAGMQDRTDDYTMKSLKNSGAVSGIDYVGGIFGILNDRTNYRDNNTHYTNINEIENSGTVTATGNYAGGLIGSLNFEGLANGTYDNHRDGSHALTMLKAVNTGDVTGVYRVGGLIGYGTSDSGNSLITEARSSANIVGTAYVGGLLGEANNISLATPDNAGSTVKSNGTYIDGTTKYAFLGGYVGRGTGVSISDANNAVPIDYSDNVNKGDYVGGIIGYTTGVLTNCENTATVNAPSSSRVGGIAGSYGRTSEYTLKNLKNSGAVSGIDYVGGIFGAFSNRTNLRDNNTHFDTFIDFTNSGEITAAGNYAGGLAGYMEFEGVPNGSYDNYRDGSMALNMQNAENTGNVTGVSYVGGLFGYFKSDSSSSELLMYTQTGTVTGTDHTDDLVGQNTNLTLTES